MRDEVRAALRDGWQLDTVRGPYPTSIACRAGRSPATTLLIAHIDAVSDAVPGAADNAASVALLLDLSERLPDALPHTICLAFPDGEEVGLRGSRALAERLFVHGDRLANDLLRREHLHRVVSLDLIGRGEPTWNGLGPAWNAALMARLLEDAPAAVPWVYRARSRAWPLLERSDHLWFGRAGIPSAHLMTRGPDGITWSYHTPADDVESLDPQTLARAADLVHRLATASPPPTPVEAHGEPFVVLPWIGIVVPGWLVRVWAGLAALVTASSLLYKRLYTQGWGPWAWAALTLALIPLCGGLAALLAGLGRPLDGSLASPAVLAAWLGALGPMLWTGHRAPAATRAVLASLLSLLLGVGLVATDLTLLAVPALTAGAAVALIPRHPALALLAPLAAWPSLYFLRPAALRELAFHNLAPGSPITLAVLLAALAPAALLWLPVERSTRPRWRRALLVGHVAVLVLALSWAWITPTWAEPYLPRDVHAPR